MKNHPLSMVVFHQPACMQGIRSPGILVHLPMGKRSSAPNRLLAGAGGIEPTLKVLETFVLPLYDAPMCSFVPQGYTNELLLTRIALFLQRRQPKRLTHLLHLLPHLRIKRIRFQRLTKLFHRDFSLLFIHRKGDF